MIQQLDGEDQVGAYEGFIRLLFDTPAAQGYDGHRWAKQFCVMAGWEMGREWQFGKGNTIPGSMELVKMRKPVACRSNASNGSEPYHGRSLFLDGT